MVDLTGLVTGPAQTWGTVRLVPLVRPEPIVDLRLHARVFGDELSMALLPDRTVYTAYVPHAFVASWTRDGTPAAAYGTQLGEPLRRVPIRTHRRMVRREAKNRLRILPLHLAMEGFLALHFGLPEIAWEDWTRAALAGGLSPRVEEAYSGAQVRGLDDALRIFEFHPGQCGLLLYVGDALAGAFVVPHPEDYRALHPTLIRDLFGELIHEYALHYPVRDFRAAIDDGLVASLADLRRQAVRQEEEWAGFHDSVMAAGLTAPNVQDVYRLGRFTLKRFLPAFDRRAENHIGELITDEEGRTAYLKTFRLSQAQVRRGYLLSELAAHGWSLVATAATLRTSSAELRTRIERAGFARLLR
ncbi:ARPP-2 domain-containing protein [Nonomuraea sp. SBT364]|uniref:ARPP-2 domain-containing protein n=1 Tax=Nonomuraea sp. SBT364 TaxID=1580530 RepID=UPI00066CFFC8|nr:hypothetical protein [Nonomuraea sp. SBT364]